MRKAMMAVLVVFGLVFALTPALAIGPGGSTECSLFDDDCDGAVDEDPVGDANGDGNPDDDFDGQVDEDPGGDALDDPGENQVTCGGTEVGGVAGVYAGANGVEVCAGDSSPLPINGRVIVTSDDGGYVAADGDNDNPAPANGYARVDGEGLHCGDETNQDSGGDQGSNTPEDCG